MAKSNGHWMEDMKMKKGKFSRHAKAGHMSIPKAIVAGMKSKSPTIKKEAVLAKTFAKFRKK